MSKKHGIKTDPANIPLEIKTVDVASLKPHPRNYVTHPDDQIEHLAESIREHGFYRNIIIAKDNTILAGHGVVQAAKKMGIKKIPVCQLDIAPDDPRAIKVIVGDNEIAHLREVDDRVFTDLLKEIKDFDVDGLLGTGFDEMMLSTLVLATRPEGEIPDMDASREWAGAGMPEHIDGQNTTRLMIYFKDEEKYDELIKLIGITKIAKNFRSKINTVWWPQED